MKVLLIPIGSHGDVHPFAALADRLLRRGHRVVVITSAAFRALFDQLGATFVPLQSVEEYRQTISNPDVWHPTRGMKLLFRLVILEHLRKVYHLVVEHLEPGETIVVSSPIGFGARIAQEKLGVPLATVHLAPMGLRSIVQPPVVPRGEMPAWMPLWLRRTLFWALDRFLLDPHLVGPVNAFRRELGLAPVQRLLKDWWHPPDLVLALFPPWFAPPPPDWPPQLRLTGFPLYDERHRAVPPGLDDFLQAGTPPVVFTPGSAMAHGQSFFQAAVEASRQLGRRALLLTHYPETLPPHLPDSVRAFDYVPFSHVFPRAAAVVHHGGVGTTAQALAAGVPQLIMPFGFDQPDNAARVVRLGVGAVVRPHQFTGTHAAQTLARLLMPTVRQRCQEVARLFGRDDPVQRACELVEGLLPR